MPKFEAPGENQNLFPATHPGLQTSSGKTTNHPFHLHRRILLVQQHERCSLRRWCLGNPPKKKTRSAARPAETSRPRFRASVLQVDRGSQPLTLLRFSFTDWRNGQVEGDSWSRPTNVLLLYFVRWHGTIQRVFNDPNCSQKAHHQSGNAKISWFQLKFEYFTKLIFHHLS